MQKKWFYFFLLLFILHQLFQKIFSIHVAVIDSYLDPFLCMPILLYGHLLERKILWQKSTTSLSVVTIVIATVLVVIIAEYFFPMWSSRFTYDILDLPMYILGAVFFYFFMNKAE